MSPPQSVMQRDRLDYLCFFYIRFFISKAVEYFVSVVGKRTAFCAFCFKQKAHCQNTTNKYLCRDVKSNLQKNYFGEINIILSNLFAFNTTVLNYSKMCLNHSNYCSGRWCNSPHTFEFVLYR